MSDLYQKNIENELSQLELYQSKEEKIIHLVNILSKTIKNIPQKLIQQQSQIYLRDDRPFAEIQEEILGIYEKITHAEQIVTKPVDEEILKESIFLIGPMGAGKSTIGNLLSSELNIPHISLDNREQLGDFYQLRGSFNHFKDFEFFLTASVLTGLTAPAVVDFGAGHLVYDDPMMFLEMQSLIQRFHHVVLLMPSEDKDESLLILNQRKGISKESYRANDNKHFVNSPCNYELATITQYTKNKTREEIVSELVNNVVGKSVDNNPTHRKR